jgi:hypothetical protein
MKKYPFCADQMQDEASKCKNCGEESGGFLYHALTEKTFALCCRARTRVLISVLT